MIGKMKVAMYIHGNGISGLISSFQRPYMDMVANLSIVWLWVCVCVGGGGGVVPFELLPLDRHIPCFDQSSSANEGTCSDCTSSCMVDGQTCS